MRTRKSGLAQVERELALRLKETATDCRALAEGARAITRLKRCEKQIEDAAVRAEEQTARKSGACGARSSTRVCRSGSADEEARWRLRMGSRTPRMLKEEVDEEDIARIVSKVDGEFPCRACSRGECASWYRWKSGLRERVVGQDAALGDRGECDSPFARRAERSEMRARLGHLSSWVRQAWAKTETGAGVGGVLSDDEQAMDGSDHERSTWRSDAVARMIGAPPGLWWVTRRADKLTEAVRRRPYSVIPARRDREGASGCVQRAVTGSG